MKDMDAAAKLFTALPGVFSDLVDFALRKTGFKVIPGSLKERNVETITQLSGMRGWYKKVFNDVVMELEITNGDVTATMLVALENQSRVSNIMAGRNLMATASRWDGWRREMKRIHSARKELKSSQEILDGVLATDRMTPTLLLVLHFGQETWTGPLMFTDTLNCPPELKSMLAECPANVISFYNLSLEEINEMPPGAFRAVAKSIHYAQQPEKLIHEWLTDPSFAPPRTDEMQAVIAIATGMDYEKMKQLKEEDMPKTVSALEQYFVSKGVVQGRAEGEAKGRVEGEAKGRVEGEAKEQARLMRKYVRNRLNRDIPKSQILEDIKTIFELDEETCRQYMEAELTNA